MDVAVIFALLLINTVDCNDGKQSVSSEKGTPLARLLLNQISRIDSTLEKLQDGEKELQKNIVAVEKKFLEKEVSSKTVAIEPILQLSYKTSSVSKSDDIQTVHKSLGAFKASSESHFKALEKKIQQQENDIISKTDLINRKISQLSSQITSINNTDEVEAIKKAIAVLDAASKTHLSADDLLKTNKGLNELKAKVLDLERQLTVFKCSDGWKQLHESCYYFGKDRMNWNAAKGKCIKLGGHLVKIESAKEHQMLHTEATKAGLTSLWMGANDISREGKWVWVSDNTPVQYTNWYTQQPDNMSNQDCGQLYKPFNFKWDDMWCRTNNQYICEKSPLNE